MKELFENNCIIYILFGICLLKINDIYCRALHNADEEKRILQLLYFVVN